MMAKHAADSRKTHSNDNKISYGNPLTVAFAKRSEGSSRHAASSSEALGVKALDAGYRKAIPIALMGTMLVGTGMFTANASTGVGIAGNAHISSASPAGTSMVRLPSSAASRSSARSPLSDEQDGSASTTVSSDGTEKSVSVEGDEQWGGIETLNIPQTKSALQKRIEAVAARNADKQAIVDKAVASSPDSVSWLGTEAVPLTLDHQEAMDAYDAASKPAGFDPNHQTGDVGNAYSFSQCTWWAYKRRHDLGLPAGSHMGDGRMWYDSGQSMGYWVSTGNPIPGDVISFQAGTFGSDGYYGHVAVVEYVSPNGDVITSESGASFNGKYFNRVFPASIARTLRYVHL